MAGIGKTIKGAAIALVLCSSSSFAAVARSAPATVNPFAVIGAYGSPAAAQALCGNAATAAVAGAAAATQAPAGCVLPVVDAAPVVADTAPMPPPVAASGGIGIWPVLLALGALAGLALLISDDDDDGDDVPVPVSPA